jgi:chromosomal replication initiation ATPase DnaA
VGEPGAVRVWEAVLARLEASISPHAFASWFRPTRGLRLQEGIGAAELVVLLPGPLHLDWLSRAYARAMLDAARAERPGLELRLLHAGPGAGGGVLVHDPGAAA